MLALRLHLELGNLVHDVHAVFHATEHAVAESFGSVVPVIELLVVHHVDEELRRGGMRFRSAGHGQRAALVGKAVARFVDHGFVGGLFVHAHAESAALNHEILDDAVENGVVVELFVHIAQKVRHGGGSLVFKKFQQNVAGGSFHKNKRIAHCRLHRGNFFFCDAKKGNRQGKRPRGGFP